MRLAVVAAVFLAAGSARAGVDWRAGRVTARGVGPADLRAPGPDIARVAAERTAEEQWKKQLRAELARLRVAGGGTLGKRAGDDALDALIAAAKAERTLYSDGSVVIEAELPLADAARLVGAPEEAGEETLIVDARKLHLPPALGYKVRAGAVERPVAARFAAEPPGEIDARATAVKRGVVTLALDEQGLGGARRVLFVVKEPK